MSNPYSRHDGDYFSETIRKTYFEPDEDNTGKQEYKDVPNEPESSQEEAPAEDENNDHLESLMRLNAEYVNYRKRVERDRDVSANNAKTSILTTLLPILDDLEAAEKHGDLEDGPFASIARKFSHILSGHGLEAISEAGVAFDPNVHEAVIAQPVEDADPDTVVQVFRTGYKSENGLIRAAQVMVAQ